MSTEKKSKIEEYLIKSDDYGSKLKKEVANPIENSFKALVVQLIENQAVDVYKRSIMFKKIEKKKQARLERKKKEQEEWGDEYFSSEEGEDACLSEDEKQFIKEGKKLF